MNKEELQEQINSLKKVMEDAQTNITYLQTAFSSLEETKKNQSFMPGKYEPQPGEKYCTIDSWGDVVVRISNDRLPKDERIIHSGDAYPIEYKEKLEIAKKTDALLKEMSDETGWPSGNYNVFFAVSPNRSNIYIEEDDFLAVDARFRFSTIENAEFTEKTCEKIHPNALVYMVEMGFGL